MVIIKVWTHPFSLSVGLIVAAVALLWPAVPLRGLDIWLPTLVAKFPTNVLYPVFAVLVGSYAALFIYDRRVAKCCRVTTAKSGAAASFFGILLGACPVCIPVLAFFLPLSFTIVLGYYSWMILLGASILIFFSLWRSGAFQKT